MLAQHPPGTPRLHPSAVTPANQIPRLGSPPPSREGHAAPAPSPRGSAKAPAPRGALCRTLPHETGSTGVKTQPQAGSRQQGSEGSGCLRPREQHPSSAGAAAAREAIWGTAGKRGATCSVTVCTSEHFGDAPSWQRPAPHSRCGAVHLAAHRAATPEPNPSKQPDQHKASLHMDWAAEPRHLQRPNSGNSVFPSEDTTAHGPARSGTSPASILCRSCCERNFAALDLLPHITHRPQPCSDAPVSSERQLPVSSSPCPGCRTPRRREPRQQEQGARHSGVARAGSFLLGHTASSLRCQTHRATHNFPSDSLGRESLPFPLDLGDNEARGCNAGKNIYYSRWVAKDYRESRLRLCKTIWL